MRKSNEFLGLDGFIWWTGVVEDRNDPLQLGRCRVRGMGGHDENVDKLPTGDLPWAQPLQPITSAALAGVGTSATGLLEGSWVVGFFMDGKKAQFPIIMGSLAGISGEGEVIGTGFRDPEGLYPTPDFKGKPDTPTLARGEEVSSNESPAYQDRILNRLENVETAKGADVGSIYSRSIPKSGKWSEPEPRGSKDSEYPYNHVRKTEAGHVFEVDDSLGAERIHTYHSPSGTFEEIQPDGTKVTKIQGENYEIIAKGQNVSITGGCNITVNGDTRIKTNGDYIHEVTGNYHLSCEGDFVSRVGSYAERVVGDKVTNADGLYGVSADEYNAKVTKVYDIDAGGSINLKSGDDIFLFAADTNIFVAGDKNYLLADETAITSQKNNLNLTAKGKLNVQSGNEIKIEGEETIYLLGPEEKTIEMGRSPAPGTTLIREGELELTGGAKIVNEETAQAAAGFAAGDWKNSDGTD